MLRRQRSVHQARWNCGLFTACIRNEVDHLSAPLRPGLCMVAPFACASRRHIHDGTADLVMGHKGFAKFTVGCHTLRHVAAVNT